MSKTVHVSAQLAVSALEALPVAVLLVDPQGRVLHRNAAADSLLPAGESLSEVLRCSGPDSHEVDWLAELAGLDSSAKAIRHEGLRLGGQGQAARLADVHLTALPGSGQGALVMVQDVTGRASMERRLATSERLAAVGKLAAQVAHELNNPLDGILRYLGLTERAAGQGQTDKIGDYLGHARQGLNRMAEIIAELLDFSRAGVKGGEWEPLEALLRQALGAMAPRLEAAGVSIVCDLASDADCRLPGNFFQVFCNLMKNAADAMPDGGRLTITARRAEGAVRVEFADTGDGIDEDALVRIFEPFFSTKALGSGTGLGLSISRDIVERAGGQITAANRPQGGAVFTVSAPCRSAAMHFGA